MAGELQRCRHRIARVGGEKETREEESNIQCRDMMGEEDQEIRWRRSRVLRIRFLRGQEKIVG